MRGSDAASGSLFSYVDMEGRVPVNLPLRTIRTIVNKVLNALDTEFEAFTKAPAGSRLRRSGCFAPHCCRRFTLSVPSGS